MSARAWGRAVLAAALALSVCVVDASPLAAGPAQEEAAAPDDDRKRTGTLTPNGNVDDGCLPGFTCQGFDVACAQLAESTDGFIATMPATEPAKGMVMFFSGGNGIRYYAAPGERLEYMQQLQAL